VESFASGPSPHAAGAWEARLTPGIVDNNRGPFALVAAQSGDSATEDLLASLAEEISGYGGEGTFLSMKYEARAMLDAGIGGELVGVVCSRLIDTPMHHRVRDILGDEVVDDMLRGKVHQRRAGRPEEIASSILFLCSEEARLVTGATSTPDGGYLTTI
jgi:Enoyl-(Acyl carrier protein) reductase